MNKVISAFRWAFGKDGSTVTQYIILYLLFYYQEELMQYGVPEAIIIVFMGIVLNLNNNALKAEINKIWDKFKKSDALVQFMKFGMSFAEAMVAADEPIIKTQFQTAEEKLNEKKKLIAPLSIEEIQQNLK